MWLPFRLFFFIKAASGIMAMFYCLPAGAQQEKVVLNIDSFPTTVKTVKVESRKQSSAAGDTAGSLYTTCEMKIGPTGKWAVRHEPYADGDESFDTIRYNAELRVKTIRRNNSFEPGTTTITYNADGTVNSVFFDADMRDDITHQYEYDKKKRLVKHIEVFTETQMVEEYAYDKDSRLASVERSSGPVGAKKLIPESRFTHAYDTSGRVIRTVEEYFGENEFVRVSDTIFWKYEDKGQKITKRESRESGKNQIIYVFRYDANGQLLSKTCQYRTPEDNGNVYVCNYEWRYDSHGNCSYRYARDGALVQEWTFETAYNDAGLPVKCIYTVDGKSYVYRWEYTYWQ